MVQFAINHMTVRHRSWPVLLDMAASLGCIGVEVRNDLGSLLFDGLSTSAAMDLAGEKGLRILALAEVKMFNDWSDARETQAQALMETAAACGAEAIALIPRNDGQRLGEAERRNDLQTGLRALKPMLNEHGLTGLVEPLGFASCGMRLKSEAVSAIDAEDGGDTFKLVHDTFHHSLSGETDLFAERTGIIHVSGVTDPSLDSDQMQDAHRVLVDANDRIGNITQLQQLLAQGYDGPISFEVFAPEIHDITDPKVALSRSIQFIESRLQARAA